MVQVNDEIARLLREYRARRGLTQEAVAALLTDELGYEVRQGKVSQHEKGVGWPRDSSAHPDLWRAYIVVLGIPENEFIRALGFTDSKAPAAPPRPTLADVIAADPTLSKAAKEHLINQYGLLQLASKADKGGAGEAKRPRRRGA